MAFVLNKLATYGKPQQRADFSRIAVGRLLDRANLVEKLSDPKNEAEQIADYWWLMMWNAYEHTYQDGSIVPMNDEERALAEICRVLNPQKPKRTGRTGKDRR